MALRPSPHSLPSSLTHACSQQTLSEASGDPEKSSPALVPRASRPRNTSERLPSVELCQDRGTHGIPTVGRGRLWDAGERSTGNTLWGGWGEGRRRLPGEGSRGVCVVLDECDPQHQTALIL